MPFFKDKRGMNMKIKYRTKFLLAFIVFLLFWFIIFHPYIVPYMTAHNFHPLISLTIFEGLLFLTMLVLSNFLIGEKHAKHSLKIAFALFVAYHIIDSVEPPFILSAGGVDLTNPSKGISWDYAIGYTLNQITGIPLQSLYYIVNIGVLVTLILILVFAFKPNILKKIAEDVFK